MPLEQLLSMFEGEFGDTYLTARTTKKIKQTVTDEACFTLEAGKVRLRAASRSLQLLLPVARARPSRISDESPTIYMYDDTTSRA
jgi:hypothetical protein